MSISENKKFVFKGMIIYISVSLFCLIFALIYYCFSHGVHSPFMTWLFAFPLILGVVPCTVFMLTDKLHQPERISLNAYNSGVAAVTVSSALRGIFEIAGTDSVYQPCLMVAGVLLLIAGIVLWTRKK